MWSFFSRDTSKDFPYEIVENVAGICGYRNVEEIDLNIVKNFSNIFIVFHQKMMIPSFVINVTVL